MVSFAREWAAEMGPRASWLLQSRRGLRAHASVPGPQVREPPGPGEECQVCPLGLSLLQLSLPPLPFRGLPGIL